MKSTDETKGTTRFRSMFGLSVALSLTLLAFEWSMTTSLSEEIPGQSSDLVFKDIPAIDLSRLEKPAVQPRVMTQAKVRDDFRIVEQKEREGRETDRDEDGDTGMVELPFVETEGEEAENLPENLRYAEVMPVFGNCGNTTDEDLRAACSERNLSEYLRKHLEFPEAPRKAGFEGTVFVKFIIDEQGDITDVEILRGVHRELDMEALRVVKAMPRWLPGKQGAKPVRIIYQLGISFAIK
jgi:protein TonB